MPTEVPCGVIKNFKHTHHTAPPKSVILADFGLETFTLIVLKPFEVYNICLNLKKIVMSSKAILFLQVLQ